MITNLLKFLPGMLLTNYQERPFDLGPAFFTVVHIGIRTECDDRVLASPYSLYTTSLVHKICLYLWQKTVLRRPYCYSRHKLI